MNFFRVIGVSEKISRLNKWQRSRFRGVGEVKVRDDFRGMSKLGGQKLCGNQYF